ncbi:MAG: hypothetical protein HQL58_02190 [Magnetococcales bacterium]|nr:hypothetical protein [Magnetococcales bacterium]
MNYFLQRGLSTSLLALALLCPTALLADAPTPVAMLVQPQGTVEYSRDGQTWEKLSRNKLLFSGSQVRTGADGSATVLNQKDGTSQTLQAGTTVLMDATAGPKATAGKLSAPQPSSGDLVASISNRMSEAQKYTTVRRSANTGDAAAAEPKLFFAKKIALSNDYPDLVWESAGGQYSYQVKIGDNKFDVPATTAALVRFKVPNQAPGNYEYGIDLVQNGQPVGNAKKEGSLQWLNDSVYAAAVKAAGQDDFTVGNVLEEHGLLVAAMDRYQKYVTAHPHDIEEQTLLIKSYHDLKLKNSQREAAVKYNEAIANRK